MNSQKKISFSFSKSSKPTLLTAKEKEEKSDVELIECLEGQSIKVKNADSVIEKLNTPLVIPLRDNSKDLLDRIRQSQHTKHKNNSKDDVENKPDSELTLDELAARQLLREATQKTTAPEEPKIHAVPLPTGSKANQIDSESTLDDYNNIPISDFGVAMLRGMGWSESSGIGKNNQQIVAAVEPELRPKGMGLGANKMINPKKDLVKTDQEEQDEDLQLVRGGYAKIIAGSNKGKYCEVMSWDDESGRIIVKTIIDQNILSLNEFLVIPVSKAEYQKSGRILNNVKYEEYKDGRSVDDSIKSKSEKDNRQASSSKSTDCDSRKRKYSDSSSDERTHRKQRTERCAPAKYDSSSSPYDDKMSKDRKSKNHHKHKKHKRKENKKHKSKGRSRDRERMAKKKKKHRRSSGSHSGGDYSSDEHIRKSTLKKKYR